jgi:hypothetical protein
LSLRIKPTTELKTKLSFEIASRLPILSLGLVLLAVELLAQLIDRTLDEQLPTPLGTSR